MLHKDFSKKNYTPPLQESLAKLHLHESIARFNQMISLKMDHIELALPNLLKEVINLDFVLCTLT
jgi:hypothetical protein